MNLDVNHSFNTHLLEYSKPIVKRRQQVQHVRRRIVQFYPLAAVDKRLILTRRLRYRKQITKDFGMALELSTVNLESYSTSDEDNVAIGKPNIRADDIFWDSCRPHSWGRRHLAEPK